MTDFEVLRRSGARREGRPASVVLADLHALPCADTGRRSDAGRADTRRLRE